jgi:hypothetical protein
MKNETCAIAQILVTYANIIGWAFIVSLLVAWGVHLLFPKKKFFTKKNVGGIALIVMGILFLIQKIPYLL